MAASSRRRAGTRRGVPYAGSPACSGVMRARRLVRKSRVSLRRSMPSTLRPGSRGWEGLPLPVIARRDLVGAAERDQHGEGEQLAGSDVDAGTGVVVAEAVGRQESLDVLLVGGRVGVHRVDDLGPDDLLLHRQALLGP